MVYDKPQFHIILEADMTHSPHSRHLFSTARGCRTCQDKKPSVACCALGPSDWDSGPLGLLVCIHKLPIHGLTSLQPFFFTSVDYQLEAFT